MAQETSDMAVQQFDVAAAKLDLDPNLAARLRRPDRAMVVSVPTRMDDGRVHVFTGYRVQHNDVFGPFKGGHPLPPGGQPWRSLRVGDVDDVEMLLGGSAASAAQRVASPVIRPNCHAMSFNRMTRRYTAEILNFIGPEIDVPAPDMGTNEQIMAWIMDTYSQHKGHAVPEIVTGKPVAIGGTLGRREATGRGVVYTIIEAAKHLGLDLISAPRLCKDSVMSAPWSSKELNDSA